MPFMDNVPTGFAADGSFPACLLRPATNLHNGLQTRRGVTTVLLSHKRESLSLVQELALRPFNVFHPISHTTSIMQATNAGANATPGQANAPVELVADDVTYFFSSICCGTFTSSHDLRG